MNTLKLHAEGQKAHLNAITEKYKGLKKALKKHLRNPKDKKEELKNLDREIKKERSHSKRNLY